MPATCTSDFGESESVKPQTKTDRITLIPTIVSCTAPLTSHTTRCVSDTSPHRSFESICKASNRHPEAPNP